MKLEDCPLRSWPSEQKFSFKQNYFFVTELFFLNKSINNDRITWLDFKVRYKDANNLEQKNENY